MKENGPKFCTIENDMVAYRFRVVGSKRVKRYEALIIQDILFVHPDDFEGFVEKTKELLEAISKGLKDCNN